MTIPAFIEDAVRAGAGQGERNARAFWLAAQLRDARIPPSEAQGLAAAFARNCTPPLSESEALASLASAYRGTPREPPAQGHGQRWRGEARPLTWESEIGPGMESKLGGSAPDYIEPVPPATRGQVDELATYLEAVFRPDDIVSYVLSAFLDEDQKYKPSGKGIHTRTRAQLVKDLRTYQAKGVTDQEVIENSLGTWTEDAGGWVRLNPMDGKGVGNDNVTDCRHVLIECDSMPIEQQLATIHNLNLPVVALVHSGGKSIHAIVRVDAGTDRVLYRQRFEKLATTMAEAGFKVDGQCKNPSRLSRLPGLTRKGNRQYLIELAGGCESWEAWEQERTADKYSAEILGPDQIDAEQPDDTLLGNRFLTRGGSWMIVAQSGIGKSVLAMQGAFSFALGRDLFGMRPPAPLRNLIVQAENNRLDIQEAYRGVLNGMELTDEEHARLRHNLSVVFENSRTGGEFAAYVDWLCQRLHPDIVWIDPLLAYLGGEISRMGDTARFLRNEINPVIAKHRIGVIMMHHTGKPPKDAENRYQGGDLAYLGIGSSDLTNWARATSTVLQIPDHENRYTFSHQKRAGKAGCPTAIDIMHDQPPHVRWITAPGKPCAGGQPNSPHGAPGGHRQPRDPGLPSRSSKYADKYGFEHMPPLASGKDKAGSPLALWIAAAMEDHGEPVDAASIDNVRSAVAKAGLIVYDKDAQMWRGALYAPDFG